MKSLRTDIKPPSTTCLSKKSKRWRTSTDGLPVTIRIKIKLMIRSAKVESLSSLTSMMKGKCNKWEIIAQPNQWRSKTIPHIWEIKNLPQPWGIRNYLSQRNTNHHFAKLDLLWRMDVNPATDPTNRMILGSKVLITNHSWIPMTTGCKTKLSTRCLRVLLRDKERNRWDLIQLLNLLMIPIAQALIFHKSQDKKSKSNVKVLAQSLKWDNIKLLMLESNRTCIRNNRKSSSNKNSSLVKSMLNTLLNQENINQIQLQRESYLQLLLHQENTLTMHRFKEEITSSKLIHIANVITLMDLKTSQRFKTNSQNS